MAMSDSRDEAAAVGTSRRRAGVVGAVIGAVGLIATLLALSANATALSPSLVSQGGDADVVTEAEVVEGDYYEDDFEIPEEFAAAEACYLEAEADFGVDALDDYDDYEDAEFDGVDWDAFYEAVVECEQLLPADLLAEIEADDAAWEAYDVCIDDAFGELDEEFGFADFGPAVSVMDGDSYSFAEFGEGDGSIVVSKTGDAIVIESTGDVEIFDEEAIEAEFADVVIDEEAELVYDEAFTVCEEHLPEGLDYELVEDYDEDLAEG